MKKMRKMIASVLSIIICVSICTTTAYEYVDKILNGDDVDLVERFSLTPPGAFVYSSQSGVCGDFGEYDDCDWDAFE